MSLLDLVGVIPAWMEHAACGTGVNPTINPEQFFPHPGQNSEQDTRVARSICTRCPVRGDCLKYAYDNNIQDGIWGGLTDRTRRRLKNPTTPQTCNLPGCDQTITQPDDGGKRRYCSDEHQKTASRSRHRPAPKACKRCGGQIPAHLSRVNQFCSEECRDAHKREYHRNYQRTHRRAAS